MTLPGGLTTGQLGTFGLTVAGGLMFGPVGFAAGALLGGFLFGSSGPTIEGPRLGDLSVSASTHGGVIPVGFAVQKVAGTMIWATEIDEDKSTDKVGEGFFGGGQKVVEYKYFANFAVSFGEGPAGGVLRIWAGGRLIADLRSDPTAVGGGSFAEIAQALAAHSKYKFRVYPGDETQEPDPLIKQHVEDEHGADSTPAHRGLVYIVFEDFPLDEFGNQIPQITAEISFAGAAEAVVQDVTHLSATSYTVDAMAVDSQRGVFYYQTASDGWGRVRISTMQEEIRVEEADILSGVNQVQVVDKNGYMYATVGVSSTSIVKVDPDSFEVVAQVTYSSDVTLNVVRAYTLEGPIDFVLALGLLSAPARVFYADDLTQFWAGQNVSTRPRGVVPGLETFGACEAWFAGAPSLVLDDDTSEIHILHVRMEVPFALSPVTLSPSVVKPTEITLTAAEFGATEIHINNIGYDELNDRLVWIGRLDGVEHLWSYSKADGVVWRVQASGDLPTQARFRNGKIYVHDGSNVKIYNATDGSLISSQSGFSSTSIIRFDPLTETLYTPTNGSGIDQWIVGRSSADTTLLSDVVTELCERVGLEASDLDVSELTDEVNGFGVARQISVRGVLELLAVAYSFDVVESDYQLKFRKRGRAVSRVLSEADLAPLSDREIFSETRTQEIDLPVRFSVRFQDADRDAEISMQTAKRIRVPDATMFSDNEATLDLPITLSATEAMGIALRQLYSSWLERVMHQWRTSWEHIDLEPSDVIQIALNDGSLFTLRILKAELGSNLEVAWETVVEESSSYTVTAVPVGGLNYLPQLDPVSSEARLFLMDTALLTDIDDVERTASGHYWAAGAYFNPPWKGAHLYFSPDGSIYAVVDETLDAVTWGSARNALGDTDTPFQTDDTNELQVNLVSGSLSSVTTLEMLNGANLAALIRSDGEVELIQFQDVALSAGVYTLTTLLRGRRGTEVFTGDHAVGDLFVLLEGEGVQRRPVALDQVGETHRYRVVGRGGDLRDAQTRQITFAGNDLKPYAPVHIEGSGSWGGPITLTWVRRTRVGGALVDDFGDVPLSEDTEEYEIDFLFFDTVMGTATGITSETYDYEAVDQAVDFVGFADVTSLLTNPSFETGSLTGWTVESGGTFVVDNAHESLTGGHGDTYFLRSSNTGVLYQTIDVSDLADTMDTGTAQARASCWIAETASDTDTGRVRLQFLDGVGAELGTAEPAATNPTGQTFVQITATGTIPTGTRQIKIRLDITRVSGGSPNVALDDVTLEIDPDGTVGSLDIAVYQVSAQVGRGHPGYATIEV